MIKNLSWRRGYADGIREDRPFKIPFWASEDYALAYLQAKIDKMGQPTEKDHEISICFAD